MKLQRERYWRKPVANPQAVIALCTTLLALAGCDSSSADIDRILSALEGKEHDLAALQAGQDKTEAELNAMRSEFAALALGIANKATQPVTEAVVVVSETQVPEPVIEPPEPVIEPKELQWGDAGYVCIPAFRSLSCGDDGKPHHLDSNLNWID